MVIENLLQSNSMIFFLAAMAVLRISLEFIPALLPLRAKMNQITPVSHQVHRWGLYLAILYLVSLAI